MSTISRRMRVIIAVILVDMLGAGLYMPVSLLFFTKVGGFPLATVGWCLSAAQLVTLPLPLVLGRLVDRLGARTVVLGGLLLQGAGFAGYLFADSPAALFCFALLAAVGQRTYWSSIFTLVAELANPKERDHAFALSGAALNAGIGIGAVLSAVLLAVGDTSAFQTVVVVNAATFVVSGIVLWVGVPRGRHEHAADDGASDAASSPLRNKPFLGLVGANTVFAICSTMLGLGLPVFLADALHGPGWMAAVLMGVNTAGLALCQTVVVKRVAKRRRTRIIFAAAVLWGVWGTLMAATLGLPTSWLLPVLLVVTLSYTLAELLHAPTSTAMASEIGPAASRGRYLSTFQFSFALANAIAPALFAQLFEWHPAAPWLALAVAALLAGGAVLAIERRLPARAVHRTAEPAAA